VSTIPVSSIIRLPLHLEHTGRSYKPVILATKGALQPGSILAAVGACEGRKGGGRTVEHRRTGRRNMPAGSRAFATIHHTLVSSALPSRPTSTDRGRQTASQRITGGLVNSPGQCCAATPVGIRGHSDGLPELAVAPRRQTIHRSRVSLRASLNLRRGLKFSGER
jgi:hypothetical protein